MSDHGHPGHDDNAPGDEGGAHGDVRTGLYGYLIGLALASLLTVISFALPSYGGLWGPSIPIALIVLAITQMGVHLTFFLHITTAPDNTNNILALCFGLLIVFLLIGGSMWIMAHMNANMAPTATMQMR